MENPWVSPWIMPSTIQLSQSAAPRAARALTPTTCPTTAVSTTVYSCWNTFPTISGRAKVMSSFAGEPSVILRTLSAIKRPLSQIFPLIAGQKRTTKAVPSCLVSTNAVDSQCILSCPLPLCNRFCEADRNIFKSCPVLFQKPDEPAPLKKRFCQNTLGKHPAAASGKPSQGRSF